MKRFLLLPAMLIALCAANSPDYQSSPERRTITELRDWGPWAGPFRDRLVPSMMQDFGERYLYAPSNAALPKPGPDERRVVFLGDSITDRWNLAEAFPGRAYVNRGIGSQVTAQMLVRFQQDVVALQPTVVVILGGVNDVTGFLQLETTEGIVSNIEAMADIADRHGIRVVLCSILPVTNTPAADYVVSQRKPGLLREVNARLRALAAARGYAYADYASVLADADGRLRTDLTTDGVHPLPAGYALMAPVVESAIAHALKAKPRRTRQAASPHDPARPVG